MMRSLYTAGTGMVAQQANVDTISNNLANVNTTGYKQERAEFADLLYQTMQDPGARTSDTTTLPTGIQMGAGVRQVATAKIYTQGPLIQTGNSFDVAIQGDGMFQVLLPDGTTAYTRAGNLVTPNGYYLQPAVTINPLAVGITIAGNGMLTQTDAQGALLSTTQITIARFINPSGLLNIGQNMAIQTAASGAPAVSNPTVDGAGGLVQYYLESSNVQVVTEMTNLIIAQRAYEMNSKAITTSDQMLEIADNLKR